MKSKIIARLAVASILSSAIAASAAEKEKKSEKPSYRAPYGMAGCGLGSLVIKENKKWPQVGAAFLNATGYQTSGITTGTSNCKMTKDDVAQREQEVFMEINLASVAKDAARGNGESLSAFAEVLGCSSEFSEFSDVSRANYETIFSSTDAKTVLENYRGAIKANPTLAKVCERA